MKLLFCGDICFNYKLDVDAAMSADILADVKGVFDAADVRIMNLETPIFNEGVGTHHKVGTQSDGSSAQPRFSDRSRL